MARVLNIDGLPNNSHLFRIKIGFSEKFMKQLIPFVCLRAFSQNFVQAREATKGLL